MDYFEAAHHTFEMGAVLARRYELVEMIGRGGMSQVFRARDMALGGELIAIKLFSPQLSDEPRPFDRFLNEVVIARRLSHPNIVRIFDFGDAGQGHLFIAMELIDGVTLAKKLRNLKAGLKPAQVFSILFELSLALEYAHRMGVVHRDLKPDNVFLTEDGTVKLGDFGSARNVSVDKTITPMGSIVGTPHYMAPELFHGEQPDVRVDIYSLGIMTFELLSGRLPFDSESLLRLVAMHVNHALPIFATKENGIPIWFQDFAETCTEKNPKDRYQCMDEIVQTLTEQISSRDLETSSNCLPASLRPKAGSGRKPSILSRFGL